MGEKNNVINHYFCDKRRFADLFNGVYFQGEAAATMLDLPQIWKERENYRSSKEGGYDMCTAVREWREELLAEGKAEGKAEAILDLLDDLGTVSEKVKNLVYGQTDLNILRDWHKKAARANCLEEFENYLTL